MDTGKILLWLVLGVVALVVLNVVVSAVFAAIGLLWWLVTTTVTLAVVGGLLYGAYRLYGLVSGNDAGSSVDTSFSQGIDYGETGSSVDDVQTRYANGEISEAELERELERQMGDEDDFDSIDRELQRERSS